MPEGGGLGGVRSTSMAVRGHTYLRIHGTALFSTSGSVHVVTALAWVTAAQEVAPRHVGAAGCGFLNTRVKGSLDLNDVPPEGYDCALLRKSVWGWIQIQKKWT